MTSENTASASDAGGDGVIRRINTALDKPLRIIGVWWCLSISISGFLSLFLDAWFVHPLPLSSMAFAQIGALFVAVLFVAYRPDVGFGKTFAFSVASLVVFVVLNFATGGEFFPDSDVSGSLYPALDIVFLSIAATLFGYALVLRPNESPD
ncbi:hypothetical protein SAMN05421858_3983 [Haladaptatus litoreus]|uniref:Uncharacterized protein n=1 Tax=Haladaptatus litoreus TaxID=553468 RepID=A0A1N7E3C0_9EURY|nr:hypothetical protein [Haladaptatus litoreus]SIR82560.1 hypothetical protein SAMN05421858_3983 [Haladaptatus litoreus]